MGWQVFQYGESHDGWVGAVLEDGGEPEPVYIDAGSGPVVHRTREWWAYSGSLGRPKAAGFRGACSCGWRGTSYPIDWDQQGPLWARGDDDVTAAREDWLRHIDDVDAQTVPLPEPLMDLVGRLRDELHALADGAPVAAVKAVGEIEHMLQQVGRHAAAAVEVDELENSWEAVGKSLGLDAERARRRVTRYLRPY
jgi:HPt (histidine-containing phosphotransfer) domain-containing protein